MSQNFLLRKMGIIYNTLPGKRGLWDTYEVWGQFRTRCLYFKTFHFHLSESNYNLRWPWCERCPWDRVPVWSQGDFWPRMALRHFVKCQVHVGPQLSPGRELLSPVCLRRKSEMTGRARTEPQVCWLLQFPFLCALNLPPENIPIF